MANKHEIDIQSIALKMLDGDTNSRNKIIDYYTNYILQTVDTRFNEYNFDKNILIENGKTGLFKAINSYTKEHKKYFSNFATTTIIEHIKRAYVKEINKLEYKNRNIQKLAEEMIKGNIEAKEKIIEFYSYHIKKIVEIEYECINCEKEDLIQAGLIGLLNAINFYLIQHNYPFSIYANMYIHKQMTKELKLYNENLTIDYIGLNNNYNEKLFINYEDDIEFKEDIKTALKKLSKLQKEILYLYNYKNYSFEEIAKIYGFTFQNAHMHYKNALKIIKNELENKQIKSKKYATSIDTD